jgi:hypothetical protein
LWRLTALDAQHIPFAFLSCETMSTSGKKEGLHKTVVAYCKVGSRYSPGGTDKMHNKLQLGQSVVHATCVTGTSTTGDRTLPLEPT